MAVWGKIQTEMVRSQKLRSSAFKVCYITISGNWHAHHNETTKPCHQPSRPIWLLYIIPKKGVYPIGDGGTIGFASWHFLCASCRQNPTATRPKWPHGGTRPSDRPKTGISLKRHPLAMAGPKGYAHVRSSKHSTKTKYTHTYIYICIFICIYCIYIYMLYIYIDMCVYLFTLFTYRKRRRKVICHYLSTSVLSICLWGIVYTCVWTCTTYVHIEICTVHMIDILDIPDIPTWVLTECDCMSVCMPTYFHTYDQRHMISPLIEG